MNCKSPTAPNRSYFNGSGRQRTVQTAVKTAADCSQSGSAYTPNVKTAASSSGNGSGLTYFRQKSGFHVQVLRIDINRRVRSFWPLARFRSLSLSDSSSLLGYNPISDSPLHSRDSRTTRRISTSKLFNGFYLLYLLSFYFNHV